MGHVVGGNFNIHNLAFSDYFIVTNRGAGELAIVADNGILKTPYYRLGVGQVLITYSLGTAYDITDLNISRIHFGFKKVVYYAGCILILTINIIINSS